MSEEGAGAAAADGDFVADEMHVVAVAQGACEAQVFRVVHGHAAGTLDQRLDDQCGDAGVMLRQMGFQRGSGTAGDIGRRFAVAGMARVGGRYRGGTAHQRRVGVLENRYVGDGQRADGLTVVAALEAEEILLFVDAAIAPAVERHLQRDLGRRGAVGGKEAMAEMTM